MKKIFVEITFENCFNFELGSCDVVMMTLGSSTPAQRYSSSSAERIPNYPNKTNHEEMVK
jgi:hypothetical protein